MDADHQDSNSSDLEFVDTLVINYRSAPVEVPNLCGKKEKEAKEEEYTKVEEPTDELAKPQEEPPQEVETAEKDETEGLKDKEEPEKIEDEGQLTQPGTEEGAESESVKETKEDVLSDEAMVPPAEEEAAEEAKEGNEEASELQTSSLHFTFSSPELTETVITSEEDAAKTSDIEGGSSAGEQEPIASEGETDKEEKEKKKGTMAHVSRFFKPKKAKEGTDEEEGSEDESKKKKKGGALGHVSRFLGKAIKKDKPKVEEVLETPEEAEEKRESDISYSEEKEVISPEIVASVADLKSEMQKIAFIINNFSRALEVKPRIITYTMVKESEELKQCIAELTKKIPNNVLLLNSLEMEETKSKFRKRWETISQELDALDTLADAIRANIDKRQQK